MKAQVIGSAVMENTVHPRIIFNVKIDHQKSEMAIVGLDGWLKINTDLIVAPLSEIDGQSSLVSSETELSQPLSALGTSRDSGLFKDSTYLSQLSAQLDEKALEQIEDSRKSNAQHAVKFKLELMVKYIQSNTRIAHFFYVKTPAEILQKVKTDEPSPFYPEEKNIKLIMSTQRDKYSSDNNAGWVISGNGSPTFLYLSKRRVECDHEINIGKWTSEYTSKLGLGRRILFELVSEGELFEKANTYLSNAEQALSHWDTKSVFANCREIGKSLDAHIKSSCGATSFAYKERWNRFYANFDTLASLDLHIEDIKQKTGYERENVAIGKPDTECLFIHTKNMIRYAQELSKMCRGE